MHTMYTNCDVRIESAASDKEIAMLTSEEVTKRLNSGEYVLINYKDSPARTWRAEKTPLGIFKMRYGYREFRDNEVTLFVPKIPEEIWRKMLYIFRYYGKRGLEVLVQVLYNRETKKYQLFIPEQTVGPVTIDYNPASLLTVLSTKYPQLILVGDFHSHHSMRAMWSITDDMYERNAQIYGVWGECFSKEPFSGKMRCRAGCAGMYMEFGPEDLFENWSDRNNKLLRFMPYSIPTEWLDRVHTTGEKREEALYE